VCVCRHVLLGGQLHGLVAIGHSTGMLVKISTIWRACCSGGSVEESCECCECGDEGNHIRKNALIAYNYLVEGKKCHVGSTGASFNIL